MIEESMVAGLVRARSQLTLPGDLAAAERAAAVAVRLYAGGASVSEACREGHRFVESWARHPSHQETDRVALRLVS